MNADTPPRIPDPIFILSPPPSFSSFFAAMLGQHPRLYAIPETHRFVAETLHEWWDTCAKTSFNMPHGLVRAVAELVYGGQNELTVQLARPWLRRPAAVYDRLRARVACRARRSARARGKKSEHHLPSRLDAARRADVSDGALPPSGRPSAPALRSSR